MAKMVRIRGRVGVGVQERLKIHLEGLGIGVGLSVPVVGLRDNPALLESGARALAKAILEKCLDCCAGSKEEVAFCQVRACSLWSIRPLLPPEEGEEELVET